MLVRYILPSVCLRLSQFSQVSFMQYMGLCVFSLPISLTMIVKILVLCLIIIIKSEVWLICHCFGLGHETIVCDLCHSIFSWLCRLKAYGLLLDQHIVTSPILAISQWYSMYSLYFPIVYDQELLLSILLPAKEHYSKHDAKQRSIC